MFAESRALSHKWRKEYGDIYRIWTGLYSEVSVSLLTRIIFLGR